MTTFNIETANKLVDHYKFLIGNGLIEENQWKITDIVIAPFDHDQFTVFIGSYRQTLNYKHALLTSGFDVNKVAVIVLHNDTYGGKVYHSNLDNYLSKMNIEKIY